MRRRAADKPSPDLDQNASPNVPAPAAAGDDGASAAAAAAEGRRPFTSLSQEEADLALARVLQEQVSARDLAGLVALRPARAPIIQSHGMGSQASPPF